MLFETIAENNIDQCPIVLIDNSGSTAGNIRFKFDTDEDIVSDVKTKLNNSKNNNLDSEDESDELDYDSDIDNNVSLHRILDTESYVIQKHMLNKNVETFECITRRT